MSAAKKALEALEAAGKAATPRPWDTGDGVCGPYLSFKGHPPGGGFDEPYDDGSEPLWLGGTVTESDRTLIVAAVNLATPLAAVARAAMERPWIICDEQHGIEVGCQGCNAKPCNEVIERKSHSKRCQFAKLDAALDALEAAAAEGT